MSFLKKILGKRNKDTHGIDLTFLLLTLAILAIGLVMLFSASSVDAFYREGDSFFYIKKQMIFAFVGLCAMFFIAYAVDYHILHRFSVPILIVTVILLIVVYFCPPVNGVHRWIPVPVVGTIQPSEIAKIAVIIMYAHLISLNYKQNYRYDKNRN